MTMKVVVVGCTHAGTAAVKNILANHPDADVTYLRGFCQEPTISIRILSEFQD